MRIEEKSVILITGWAVVTREGSCTNYAEEEKVGTFHCWTASGPAVEIYTWKCENV